MTDPSVPSDGTTAAAAEEHEARRLRGPRRLLRIGPLVAFLGAVGSGLLGADGRIGFVIFLLLLALSFAVTGVWVGGLLVLDQLRDRPTSRHRGLLTIGMFVATFVCMTAVGGLAGSGSTS